MDLPADKKIFLYSGYLLWILMLILVCGWFINRHTDEHWNCYSEIVQRNVSPQGNRLVEIDLFDCGGATTDYVGHVRLRTTNEDEGVSILKFAGRPDESGLTLQWLSNDKLLVKVSSIHKLKALTPENNPFSGLHICYEIDPAPQVSRCN